MCVHALSVRVFVCRRETERAGGWGWGAEKVYAKNSGCTVNPCRFSKCIFSPCIRSSASHGHQTSTSPTTPSSPETVPLISASADHHSEEEAEEEKEEETTQTEPAAEQESE